ncbi:MAG: outer membrane beta-barrel protein [Paludibacter sp.]
MKRKLSILVMTVIICMSANHLHAQNLYVSVSGGGAFSTSSQNVPEFLNITSTTFTTTQEQIHLSLGQGSNYGGSVGYMFNKNIGAELGLSFLIGAKTNSQGTAVGSASSSSYSSNMTRVVPTIVIASGMEKINPYAKFGIIFGSGDVIYSGKETKGTDVFLYDIKMNGGNALGVSSCVGVQYILNKQLVLFIAGDPKTQRT